MSRQLLVALLQKVRRSQLLQATIAIGVAGMSRIVLNSVVGFTFGATALAAYATGISSILLWSGLANAGPSAAITLTIARRCGAGAGQLPGGLLRFLAALSLMFLVGALVLGSHAHAATGGASMALWIAGVAIVTSYQSARAVGYATEGAADVTIAETTGALAMLATMLWAVLARPVPVVEWLIGIYLLGLVTFLTVFFRRIRERIRVVPGVASREEQLRGLRVTGIFFIGSGSSLALQYLPVLIAAKLHAPATAAVVFGSLQATAPLLLLPRVYGTVMMPAFAARLDDDRPGRHMSAVAPVYLPTLAIGLGIAPWIVLSLGLSPDGATIAVASMVALLTLTQLWAAPAVTVLSSRDREWLPALASVAGLLLAAMVWWMALLKGEAMLLPIGLLLGGIVRSLIPMWSLAGTPWWPKSKSALLLLAGTILLGMWAGWAMRQNLPLALTSGALLVACGAILGIRAIKHLRSPA